MVTICGLMVFVVFVMTGNGNGEWKRLRWIHGVPYGNRVGTVLDLAGVISRMPLSSVTCIVYLYEYRIRNGNVYGNVYVDHYSSLMCEKFLVFAHDFDGGVDGFGLCSS